MGEIVSLRSGEYTTPEVIDELVQELEKLKEAAAHGEIKGFSFAYVDSGDFLHTFWIPGSSGVSRLVGATSLLNYRLAKAWDDAPK